MFKHWRRKWLKATVYPLLSGLKRNLPFDEDAIWRTKQTE
jgi:hypothetical protein